MLWSYDLLILTWPRLLHQPLIINDGTIGLHYVMKTRPSRWSVQRIHEQIFWEYGPRFWKLSLSVSLQPPSVRSVPQERACRTCSIAALWPSRLTSGRFRSYLPRVSLTPTYKHPAWASTFFCESLRDGNRDRFNAWQLDNKRGLRDNFPFGRLGLSCI